MSESVSQSVSQSESKKVRRKEGKKPDGVELGVGAVEHIAVELRSDRHVEALAVYLRSRK